MEQAWQTTIYTFYFLSNSLGSWNSLSTDRLKGELCCLTVLAASLPLPRGAISLPELIALGEPAVSQGFLAVGFRAASCLLEAALGAEPAS